VPHIDQGHLLVNVHLAIIQLHLIRANLVWANVIDVPMELHAHRVPLIQGETLRIAYAYQVIMRIIHTIAGNANIIV
jgi:hypothetical protein